MISQPVNARIERQSQVLDRLDVLGQKIETLNALINNELCNKLKGVLRNEPTSGNPDVNDKQSYVPVAERIDNYIEQLQNIIDITTSVIQRLEC